MTITDQRTFDAVNNLRAYVAGCGEDVEQEMNDDIEELIAAVTDMVAKRLGESHGQSVDLAEGQLLNEIHEHISVGIILALESLVISAETEGENKMKKKIRKCAEFTSAWNPILNGPLVTASYGGVPAHAREDSIAIIPAHILNLEVSHA